MTFYCNIALCNQELVNLHYMVQKNNTIHLVGYCSLHKTRFINYIPGLSIPSELSKKAKKIKNGDIVGKTEPQPTLF